jgi:hypothetical protein
VAEEWAEDTGRGLPGRTRLFDNLEFEFYSEQCKSLSKEMMWIISLMLHMLRTPHLLPCRNCLLIDSKSRA